MSGPPSPTAGVGAVMSVISLTGAPSVGGRSRAPAFQAAAPPGVTGGATATRCESGLGTPALADEPFEPNLSGHPGNLTMRTPRPTPRPPRAGSEPCAQGATC